MSPRFPDPASRTRYTTCPVCGGDNDCDRAAGRTDCWCDDVTPHRELRDWLAARGNNPGCLCARCATGQVPSPCRRICVLDRSNGICRGCARSMAEIASWGAMGPVERARVLLRVRGSD